MKKQLFLGEEIITNKKFFAGEGFEGQIVKKADPCYGIYFKDFLKLEKAMAKKEKFIDRHKCQLHFLERTIKEKAGYYLEPSQFKVTSQEIKEQDENKNLLIRHLREQDFLFKRLYDEKISKELHEIESRKRMIIDNKREIETWKEKIKEQEQNILKLKKEKDKKIEIGEIVIKLNNILKCKDIKEVFIEKETLIIRTNPLTYIHNDSSLKPFSLGSYLLFIDMQRHEISAANYTHHYMKGRYHHPCVESRGKICFGSTMKKEISKAFENNDIQSIIFSTLHFLKKPDYQGPYLLASYFVCRQRIKNTPKNVFDYFKSSFWEKEDWDMKLYEKQSEKYREIRPDNEDED